MSGDETMRRDGRRASYLPIEPGDRLGSKSPLCNAFTTMAATGRVCNRSGGAEFPAQNRQSGWCMY
jgi:hypothetical protein